jgi:hypothetical protein
MTLKTEYISEHTDLFGGCECSLCGVAPDHVGVHAELMMFPQTYGGIENGREGV